MGDETRPIVEVRGATVRFQAEKALDGVDFRMFAGEVHSLMGENGAGKSTLIKALTGALPLDSGSIQLERRGRALREPARRARRRHQHGLPGDRPAAQPQRRREHLARPRAAPARRHRLEDACGAPPAKCSPIWASTSTLPPPSATHSLAIQQLVAIARAISTDVKVLVLDEPTSSLDLDEVAELFRVMRELKQRGVAILFVSHFLDQVYEICDRVTVLRNGRLVGEYLTRELLRIDLVQKMLGRSAGEFARAAAQRNDRRDRAPVPERPRCHGGLPASSGPTST